jgi:hypothetical protein
MSAAHDPGKGVTEADAHDDEHAAPLYTFSNRFAADMSQPQPQAKCGRPRNYIDPSVAIPMPLAIVQARHPTNDILRPPVMPLPVPPPPPPPVKKRRVQAQRSTPTKKTAAGM